LFIHQFSGRFTFGCSPAAWLHQQMTLVAGKALQPILSKFAAGFSQVAMLKASSH